VGAAPVFEIHEGPNAVLRGLELRIAVWRDLALKARRHGSAFSITKATGSSRGLIIEPSAIAASERANSVFHPTISPAIASYSAAIICA
jgi:hypothetical protein